MYLVTAREATRSGVRERLLCQFSVTAPAGDIIRIVPEVSNKSVGSKSFLFVQLHVTWKR